ncbi:hypothetical protein [Candidatus Methanoprimaticola sp. MG2]|uniref:hypothetical protein n=1 Tax=Candidatus Methanoprimaticola sp. MG2 TaxID=3228838 RepID=UPI0039C64AF3
MTASEETVLAAGEEIVRRYSCTAVDRVAMFAGSVMPLPGRTESEGVLTLTNRRVIFHLSTESGKAYDRQEVRLSEVSAVSSMMSKFGRDLRVPMLLIVIGFLMMFVPFAVFSETGALDTDMDYQDGYNDGVEYGYFKTYLEAVQAGEVTHGIPDGYFFYPPDSFVSQEYYSGYQKGNALGVERAVADIAADAVFSVPSDLKTHHNPTGTCLVLAVIGAFVFVSGSVVYLISNRTKDWISIRLGTSGRGICVKSFNGGWSATGSRALTAENQYWDMTRELGAAIMEIWHHKERRLRFFDDDVVIGEDAIETGFREEMPESLMERTPDYDDDTIGELIIDDDCDDEGPRIIGPWREE